MPFCPNCRTEYVGEATRCADCGAELVGWPTPRDASPASLEASRPAELCQVDNQVQADLIEAQLRAAGIPTVRRPRTVALFVPAGRLAEATRVLAGQPAAHVPDTFALSELNRIRLVCDDCEKVTPVDLLADQVPASCSCGHVFDLGSARAVLDRYRDLMRTMADADFEIEIEPPEAEE